VKVTFKLELIKAGSTEEYANSKTELFSVAENDGTENLGLI